MSGPLKTMTEADLIVFWKKTLASEQRKHKETRRKLYALTGALERYRYAARWSGADSWDGCSDCVDRLRWASERDAHDMTNDEIATVGHGYLADRAEKAPTP